MAYFPPLITLLQSFEQAWGRPAVAMVDPAIPRRRGVSLRVRTWLLLPPKRCARHARNVNLTNIWSFSATRVPVLNRGRVSRLHRARQSTRASTTHRGEPYRAPGFRGCYKCWRPLQVDLLWIRSSFGNLNPCLSFRRVCSHLVGHGWLASPPRPAALMARPPGSVR